MAVRCGSCPAEHLAVFGCEKRGSCPSYVAWRVVESIALLVHEELPEQRVRRWVLSVSHEAGSKVVFGRVWEKRRVRLKRLVTNPDSRFAMQAVMAQIALAQLRRPELRPKLLWV